MDDARHEPSERGHPVAAAAYDLVNAYAERRVFPEHRRYLARDLRGEVLDLGAGTGAMFPYFRDAAERRPSLSVTAVDPDPHMRTRAERSADELGLDVAVRPARAESLPFADGHFDAVVASLVFCTIPEPERALAEIRRVLEPGGEFRFFEHVRSPGWLGRLQDAATPLWKRLTGGCHLDRRTAETVADGPLELVDLAEMDVGWVPVKRFVRGTAVVPA